MLDACTSRRDIHRFQSRAFSFITGSPAALRKKKPLAEGLQVAVPTDSHGRRLWKKMSNRLIIEVARKFIKENKIGGKKDLERADSGLYQVLQRKKLFEGTGLEEKRRFWAKMDDEEIVEIAREFIEENGISGRGELERTDLGLYTVLRKRRLLGKAGLEKKQRKKRDWKDMGDGEIVEIARKLIEEKEISGRSELQRVDNGVYYILRKRRLLGKVGFVQKRRKHRPWKNMGNREIIEIARKVIEENNITTKGKLKKTDAGLHNILKRRKLFGEVGFGKKIRSWKKMSDEELVDLARKFIERKGISGKKELQRVDNGLYIVLIRRELIDKLDLEERKKKERPWKDMDDEKVIRYAWRVIKESGVTGRSELLETDSGLYHALRKRGLLDQVFAHIDQQRTNQARDAVIDALTKFANSGKMEVEVA